MSSWRLKKKSTKRLARIKKKIKSMQSFVDRFGAKASKATQAQSMIKIEKMGVMNALDANKF